MLNCYVCIALLQVVQLLLNTVGETVTGLFNLSVKHCDGSWLTQLLLMLRSHVAVLRTLCAIICHLVTRQANALSDCHAHALAAIMVHWSNDAQCATGILVEHKTEMDQVIETLPIVPYVLQSLPLSTAVTMSFSLSFAASYVVYANMVGHAFLADENQMLPDQPLVKACAVTPSSIVQLLSYLGPRLIKDLRLQSSNLGSKESVVSCKFSSIERFLLNDSVRRLVEKNPISFEMWVRKEIEVMYDEDVSPEWLSEYYNWVVFTRWHKPSVTDSATPRMYLDKVLQQLARAVLEFDIRYSHPHTCGCCHKVTNQSGRLKQAGCHNVFSLLQASRN